MSWTTALMHWQDLLPGLCGRFPHLDGAAVARFRGDQHKLVHYLAETHDLTLREALELLEDWLAYQAPAALQAA